MKKLIFLLALIFSLLGISAYADDIPNAVLESKKSTVRIITVSGSSAWNGSGICVGEKGKPVQYILTNSHVAEGDNAKYYVVLGNNGENIAAHVWKANNTANGEPDLAVLQLTTPITERIPIRIRDFDIRELKNNDAVFTLGYPGNNSIESGADFPASGMDKCVVQSGNIQTTMTRGESNTNRSSEYRGEQISHDANMSPGNSGGPLVDKKGLLLGINTFVNTKSISNTSISANEIRRFLDSQGIPYIIEKEQGISLIVVLACIVAILIVLIIIVILNQRKTKPEPKPEPDPKPEPKPGPKPEPKPDLNRERRFIRCDKGEAAGKTKELIVNKKIVIGREGDFEIPDTPNTRNISRQHCSILYDGKSVTVTDLNSAAHTYIYDNKNGLKEVPAGETRHLHRGQELRLGNNSSKPLVFSLHSHN